MKTKNAGLQRKMRLYAPLHIRKKFMKVALSKELRKQLKRRSMGVRSGDQVQIIKGKFKGTSGIVTSVDLKKMRVYVDTAVVKKRNGTQAQVALVTPKLRIIKLVTTDKKRQSIMETKSAVENVAKDKTGVAK
ncbi:MAG: 50S ribosomal protein L24 [Candidatus Aenigmatarchaeota archaeon]